MNLGDNSKTDLSYVMMCVWKSARFTFMMWFTLFAVYCTGEKVLVPDHFSAVAVDDQSITFVWQMPQQPMTDLSVRLWVWNDSETHMTEIYPVKRLMRGFVSGLYPLTEYNTTLSIYKVGENVNHTADEIKTVLTFPGAPSVSISNVSENSIGVTFEPMRNGKEFNVKYEVVANRYGEKRSTCNVYASNQNTYCTLGGLDPYTWYSIAATACVKDKCSVSSRMIQVQTSGVRYLEAWFVWPAEIKAQWEAYFPFNSSNEFRIIVDGKLDPTCRQPLNKTQYNCKMHGYRLTSTCKVQLATCRLNESNPNNCTSLSYPTDVYPEWAQLQAWLEWPNAIEAEWNANVEFNSSGEFRIMVAGKLDATCRKPHTTKRCNCTMQGYNVTSEYDVQLAVCRTNENNENNCAYLGNSTQVYPEQRYFWADAFSKVSGTIDAEWKVRTVQNASMEFRILVNETLDPTCKEPLGVNDWQFCTLTGYTPNTVYYLKLVICRVNETYSKHCLDVLKDDFVLTAPEAPKHIVATAVDAHSMQFAWEMPSQPTTGLDFGLETWANDVKHGLFKYATENVSALTIGSLIPLTKYNATLCIRGYRHYSCSEEVQVLTPPNVPNTTVNGVGTDWIRVAFQPLKEGESFDLIYSAVATDVYGNQRNCSNMVHNGKVECVISGLTSHTVYNTTAKACADSLCSLQSPIILVKTKEQVPDRSSTEHTDHTAQYKLTPGEIVGIVIIVLLFAVLVLTIYELFFRNDNAYVT